jgi:membrane associated rhomboid family serine protease
MIPISDSIHSKRFPLINLSLIAITVFVFFQQLTTPDPEGFIETYALIPALVDFSITESLFPLVSSIFLHGGFLHIASNMVFLWVFGDNVEGHLGIFYPILYFASGIAGGLSQYILNTDSPVPMLGASGAIAGVLGSYYILLPHSKIKTLVPFFGFVSVVEIPATIMLGYWFLLQVLSGAVSLSYIADATGGITFFAHIGGFVAGLLITMLLKPFIK